MGLDMYLTKRTYVKNWEHMKNPEKTIVHLRGERTAGIDPTRITEIIEEVMYWRKANAIHNWFVRECQEGVDECQETCVSADKLRELMQIIEKILKNKSKRVAKKYLPSGAGFFFGSTDYDEWYFKDLESTLEVLKKEEPLFDKSSYYYQSSW